MEDIMDNKLTVTAEDGTRVEINVLDIIDSYAYNKTFTSYSLDTITNQEEINYINSEINRVANEVVESN